MGRSIFEAAGEWARRLTCKHEWRVDAERWDAEAEAGSRTPTYLVCVKCRKRSELRDISGPLWWNILLFPFILVGLVGLLLFGPLITAVVVLWEHLFTPKRTAAGEE